MNDSIKKTDQRGRLRYAPEQKKSLVDAYLVSGLSAPRFASLHGVPYQTLIAWIKKANVAGLTKTQRSEHPALLSLVAAEIDHSISPHAPRGMEVLLSGGEKILISSPGDVDLAAALIHRLHHLRPC